MLCCRFTHSKTFIKMSDKFKILVFFRLQCSIAKVIISHLSCLIFIVLCINNFSNFLSEFHVIYGLSRATWDERTKKRNKNGIKIFLSLNANSFVPDTFVFFLDSSAYNMWEVLHHDVSHRQKRYKEKKK